MSMSNVDRGLTCRLCGMPCSHFAKSHIIPWGFVDQCEHAHDMSLMSEGEYPRRRNKGIYDDHILCDECEHRYFYTPDDYAIRIYRNLQESEARVDRTNKNLRYIRFGSIDRQLLRMFFASVLWRCSVAQCAELKDFSIGKVYERRIAADILSNGAFDYIDAVGFRYDAIDPENDLHSITESYAMPIPTRLQFDNRIANGFNLYLPNYKFAVSLDQRPNPFSFVLGRVELFDGASPSISKVYNGAGLMIFQGSFPEELFSKISNAAKSSRGTKYK